MVQGHYVPLVGYDLLSLKMLAERGHNNVGEKKGATVHLNNRKTLFGPAMRVNSTISQDPVLLLIRTMLRLQRLHRVRLCLFLP